MLPATINEDHAAIMERVVIEGDLSKLKPAERVNYYRAVCESVGLNPLTKPFDYITLNGKLTLYAKKDATDQLRSRNGVSIDRIEHTQIGDVYQVTAYASNDQGRSDADIGVVTIKNLAGDKLANAMMKAVTKAKRRVTLSLCGLGWLDETEIETISDAQTVVVDDTGHINGNHALDEQLDKLLNLVNGKCDGFYGSANHMLETLQLELDEKHMDWPDKIMTKHTDKWVPTLVEHAMVALGGQAT